MCRWLAYLGAPIFLDTLLLNPVHSLIDQSRNAELSEYRTNGDGFGVGWYGELPFPGVYRNIRPAWNDTNLINIAQQIRSGHFLAHVRSTTGTAIQTTNCHPFRFDNWLFQHNGEINGFELIKRELAMVIAPELYPKIEGSTDTEHLFYLAITYGLREDPLTAFRKTVGKIETLREQLNIEQPFRFTAAASDGRTLYALRYSSNGVSNTLFHSTNVKALHEICSHAHDVPSDGIIILSEPLDRFSEHWAEIPDSTFLIAHPTGEVRQEPFEPG